MSETEISEADQRILVTVSIGGSGLPDKNATNPQDLILVADAAMYSIEGIRARPLHLRLTTPTPRSPGQPVRICWATGKTIHGH